MRDRPLPFAARGLALAVLLAAPALPVRGVADTAYAAEDVPLPLTGRQTVKAIGKRYVIDGKQTIPPGAVIRLEANVRVAGVNGASLDVRGGFRTSGIDGSRVKIENVDFSPTVAPDNEVHFDMTDLSGCSFSHAGGASFSGGFTMENTDFSSGTFAFRIQAGYVKLMTVKLNGACSIEGNPDKGTPPEISIRTATLQTLSLSGNALVTLRGATLMGALHAERFTSLVVDGCELSGDLTFVQPPEGSFSKLQLTKCNLLAGSKLVFRRPAGPKTPMEKVRIDKFHFGTADGKADMTDKQIAGRVQDGADDPEVSVKAFWQNAQERPR